MKSTLLLIASFLLLGLVSAAQADSVWAGGLERRNVKILGVKEGKLQYESAGQPAARPLSEVERIMIDGEQALNAAEEAYKLKDWEKASSEYQRTLKIARTPQQAWLNDWCRARLLDAAAKGNRFDAAITAYIQLVETNPEAAKQINLDLPQPDSAMLTAAAKELELGVKKAGLKAEGRIALYDMLQKIYAHQGKKKEADAILKEIAELRIAANPNSPEALAAKMQLQLTAIQRLIDDKEYDKAIAAIEKDAGAINDAADQVRALTMIADAKAGKAGNSTDATVWKEVAVAYLRVVVNAPPKSSSAASALMRLAQIHETKLNEKASALKLYQTVASDYKELPIAKEAEREAKRLQG